MLKILLTTPILLYSIFAILFINYYIDADIPQHNWSIQHKWPKLPNRYQQCFIINKTVTSRKCTLPNDITLIVDKQIGSGAAASIWLTQIYYNYSKQQHIKNYDIYIMKYTNSYCNSLHNEYKFFKRIYKHNTTQVKNINIPSVHPLIPFYTFENNAIAVYQNINTNKTCFFFMEYLANTTSLYTFSNMQTLQSFNEIDGGVLQFLLRCYDDIITAMNGIYYSVYGFQNDINPGNILIDINDHKCYLIDFGHVFYIKSSYLYEKHTKKFQCNGYVCSSIVMQSLYSNVTRIEFRDKYLSNGYTKSEIKKEFGKIGMLDMKYKVTSMLMHWLLEYITIGHDKYNYLREINIEIGRRKNNFDVIWCKRLELLNHLNLDHMDNNSTQKQRFWELMTVFDVDKEYIYYIVNSTCDYILRS